MIATMLNTGFLAYGLVTSLLLGILFSTHFAAELVAITFFLIFVTIERVDSSFRLQ